MSVHREVELLERQPVLNSQGRLRDQVGGARSDDVNAQQATGLRIGDDLDEALGLPQSQRPARGGEWDATDLDIEAALFRLFLTQSDMRDLWIRVHAVGSRVVVRRAIVTSDVLDRAYIFI